MPMQLRPNHPEPDGHLRSQKKVLLSFA